MNRFLKYHLPAILYGLLVIILSSVAHFHTPSLRFIGVDKVIHFLEYAIFAVLVFRSFSHISERLSDRSVFLLSLLFLSLFAALDETYQKFIPGRQPDLTDAISDISGSILILILLWFWRSKRRKLK